MTKQSLKKDDTGFFLASKGAVQYQVSKFLFILSVAKDLPEMAPPFYPSPKERDSTFYKNQVIELLIICPLILLVLASPCID